MPSKRISSCLSLPRSRRVRSYSLVWLASFVLAVAADEARRSFNVPADAAEPALRKFAEQAGIHLIFPPDITDGIRTRGVKGELNVGDAANRLLEGTNLKLVPDRETGVYTLARVVPTQRKAPEASRRPHDDTSGESPKKKELKPPEPRNR